MKSIVLLALIAVSGIIQAGLFDAVKNVANAVGGGSHCQVTLPSGVQCSNSPVTGSQYCSEHKCSLCNAAAWAGGLCRSCDSTKEVRLRMVQKEDRRKEELDTKKKSEEALLRRQSGGVRIMGGRRSRVRERVVGDPTSFAGFKFGMIMPFGQLEKNVRLNEKFLRIFESVDLTYNKNNQLLCKMDFWSIPLHVNTENEMQKFIDSVCADVKDIYGHELKFKGGLWQERKGECMIGLGCQSASTITDGNKDEYKRLFLTFVNKKMEEDMTVVEQPIVPYGKQRFLHKASGLIYSFRKEGGQPELYIESIEDLIARQKNYVIKVPISFIHGKGIAEEGEHKVEAPLTLLNGIRFKGDRVSYDLSEFAVDQLKDVSVKIDKFRNGIEKVCLPNEVVTNKMFVAKLLAERDPKERKKVADFYGCLNVWMEYVERPLELAAAKAQKAAEDVARKEAEKRQREHEAFVKQYGEQVAWMDKPIATAAELVEWMRSKKKRTSLQIEEDFKDLKGQEIIVHGKVNDIGRFSNNQSMLYASIRIGRLGTYRDIDMKCVMSAAHVKTARKWDLNMWVTIKGKIDREADSLDRDDLILWECEPVRSEDFSIWCRVNGFTAERYESENQRMIEDDLKSAGGILSDAALLLLGGIGNSL